MPGPWVRNELWRRARAVPSLDLRFADDKTLTDAVTGQNLITFTRASSGTFVDSAGVIQTATTDVPRFDHNPTTGESLGLLVEEQRTNLLVRSEEFDNASWTKTAASITPDASTAPDGTITADDLTITTSQTVQGLSSSTFTADGTSSYTFSIFIKKTISTGVNLNIYFRGAIGSGGQYTGLTLNTQSGFVGFNLNSATSGTYSVQDLGSWWRVSSSAGGIPAGSMRAHVRLSSQGVGTVITLWGAQLEVGAFPTSYIPTTSATVTRSADVASITGTAFSSWYRQDEGTVFAEYRTPASDTRGVVGFNDNTANERIAFYTSGADPKLTVVDGGVTQADINGGTVTASVMTKSAGAFAVNDFALAHAGGAAVTDTNGTMPTPDRVLIGADQAGNYQNDRIRRLTYWPTRLANSTLQEVTR
jgi:hypothetical protein